MTERDDRQMEAAKHLLKIRAAEQSFVSFVEFMHPEWRIPKFHYKLAYLLDCMDRNQLYSDFEAEFEAWWVSRERHGLKNWPDCYPRREDAILVHNAMVNMPPRHSKSTYCTELFPAYYMGREPSRYTMTTSYNAELAVGFGRNVQAVIEDPRFHQVFPEFMLNDKSTAVDNWRTIAGGAYYSIGIGGTTSGRPATLQIIDDPVKSRVEAESMSYRNRCWDFYTSALDTRLQPEVDGTPPKRLVVLTRWHPDDMGGRIQDTQEWADKEWLHVNFPAITVRETGIKVARNRLDPHDPDYMTDEEFKEAEAKDLKSRYGKVKEEAALWPERFPLDVLIKKRRLNERDFEALYQQRPFIQGGNLIKESWWQWMENPPEEDEVTAIIIGVDTAFKATSQADYSVFCVGALLRTGDYYIQEIKRGKWTFPDLKRQMILLNGKYRGKGLRAFYVEDRASGQSLIQEFRRESGITVLPYKVGHTDKVARVNQVTPFIEGGRVFLPKSAPWLDEFMRECSQFPASAHDDQVDTLSMTLDILSRMSSPVQSGVIGQSLYTSLGQGNGQQSLNTLVSGGRVPRVLGDL